MIRSLVSLLIITGITYHHSNAQESITNELAKADSVKAGASLYDRIGQAISYAESYIIARIGKDNFHSNYKFDSTFNDILWMTLENGNYSKHSKPIKSEDSYNSPIEEFSGNLRLVYHYNFSYRNVQYPKKGFGLYIQLAGNKSTIDVQGLIELTGERNLTNILTREEILVKIRQSKFKREIRKSIKRNITVNQITHDFDQFKGEAFEKIYYTILLKDIKEPAFYKFDPWTGEFCCSVKTRIR